MPSSFLVSDRIKVASSCDDRGLPRSQLPTRVRLRRPPVGVARTLLGLNDDLSLRTGATEGEDHLSA
jgi:hypothetical protein